MKNTRIFILVVSLMVSLAGICQQSPKDLSKMSWKQVANKMPAAWYGSEQACRIADQLVARQMDCGGWQKNLPYHRLLSTEELSKVRRSGPGATIDNGATTTEMRFLAKVYAQSKNERYKTSFLRGFSYLMEAQYDNGGWPQFYPARKKGHYSSHITFNDNAYVNVMYLLRDVIQDKEPIRSLQLSDEVKRQARVSFDKGIACILKTQIRVDGEPTVWCAQHDEFTLAPAPARAYELESFSGAESVEIVRLLMSLPDPSAEVIAAVTGAVRWFEAHAIKDMEAKRISDGKERDTQIKSSPGHDIWARFYDLQTGKPFFCDRDGVKRATLAEVGKERRGGYSWYTTAPQRIIDAYPEWLEKVK